MSCDARFAEPWQYASFFCSSSIQYGEDDSGGAANLFLTDSIGDFIKLGMKANVGQRLYNLTSGLDGLVTAVTATTLTATGVTWDDGDEYRVTTMDRRKESAIKRYLDSTAGRIQIALQTVGACDCTFSTAGASFLADLNVRLAGIYHECPCGGPNLNIDEKRLYMEGAAGDLEAIRSGELEVCAGETGTSYPAVGSAAIGWTEFSQAEIIENKMRRESS